MNFVAEDWIEKDNLSGALAADNNAPALSVDSSKVCTLQINYLKCVTFLNGTRVGLVSQNSLVLYYENLVYLNPSMFLLCYWYRGIVKCSINRCTV